MALVDEESLLHIHKTEPRVKDFLLLNYPLSTQILLKACVILVVICTLFLCLNLLRLTLLILDISADFRERTLP